MTDETLTDIDDIYASMLAQLEKEKAELLDALSDLLDEQNGPPIWSRANEWQAICDRASTAIKNAEKKGTMKETHIMFTYKGNFYSRFKKWDFARCERVLKRLGASYWEIG